MGRVIELRAKADIAENRNGQSALMWAIAEGRITVTGSLMKLFDGTGFLIDRTGAKVITCYLRNARRTPFVRHTGWTRWRPAVTAHFSDAISPPPRPEGPS